MIFEILKSDVRKRTTNLEWVNAAKGIGIVLVVFGHALAGLLDSGIAELTGWASVSFYMMYLFHMPMFFLLSGLFVPDRLDRSPSKLVRQSINRIVVPYLIWSVVQVTVIAFGSRYANHPVENLGLAFVEILYDPTGQFWFLYALFLMHVLAAALIGGLRFTIGQFLIVIVLLMSLASRVELPWILELTIGMSIFYSMGMILRGPIQKLSAGPLREREAITALTCLIAIVSILAATRFDLVTTFETGGVSVAEMVNMSRAFGSLFIGLVSSLAVIFLCQLVPTKPRSWLVFLGKRSMAIYLLHILFVATGRIVIVKVLSIQEPVFLSSILLLGGILGPLAVWWCARLLRLNRFLGLG